MIYALASRRGAFGIGDYLKTDGRDVAHLVTVLTYDDVFDRGELPIGTYLFTGLEELTETESALVGRVRQALAAASPSTSRFNDPVRWYRRGDLLQAAFCAGAGGGEGPRAILERSHRCRPLPGCCLSSSHILASSFRLAGSRRRAFQPGPSKISAPTATALSKPPLDSQESFSPRLDQPVGSGVGIHRMTDGRDVKAGHVIEAVNRAVPEDGPVVPLVRRPEQTTVEAHLRDREHHRLVRCSGWQGGRAARRNCQALVAAKTNFLPPCASLTAVLGRGSLP